MFIEGSKDSVDMTVEVVEFGKPDGNPVPAEVGNV